MRPASNILRIAILLVAFLIGTGAAYGAPPNSCANVVAYGADQTGGADTATAFSAAVAANDPSNICVYFPAGTYRFSSTPAVSLASGISASAAITIKGDGASVSKLKMDSDVNGPNITLNSAQESFHIRDLAILASNKSSSSIGLNVGNSSGASNPAQSDISGVSIGGSDGYGGSNRFIIGVNLDRIGNVNIINSLIDGSRDGSAYASQGICLSINATSAVLAVQYNIIGSQLNFCGQGIHYGPYVQGIQISASNFTGNGTAIYQPSATVTGNDQLSITGSQFNSGSRNIYLLSPIDGVTISSSLFYIAGNGTAEIDIPGIQFAITGNTFVQFSGTPATGINVNPYKLDAGIISGNSFNGFNTGVLLAAGSQHVNVQSNAYSSTATNVQNNGMGNTIGGGTP